MSDTPPRMGPITIGLVAGESSGDLLGARLMAALRRAQPGVRFVGVGGPLMEAQGLVPLFPMADIAVNGFLPVLKRLPSLLKRINDATEGLAAARPDIVVHIDAQDFNKRVAAKLRHRLPKTPLVGYVAPTVWAWRPGRAKILTRFYNKMLAVLPFEPEVMDHLGGPPTVYVGHPLLEDDWPSPERFHWRPGSPPKVLLLPGSRRAEIAGLLAPFGEAAHHLADGQPGLEILLPTVPHLADAVRTMTASWRVAPRIIVDDAEKATAFRSADLAIAASGTVTLELALAGVPTVAAYRIGAVQEALLRRLVKTRFATLPNIILDQPLLPELLGAGWSAADVVAAAERLLQQGAARDAQLKGFAAIKAQMAPGRRSPSELAAEIVLETLRACSPT